MHSDALIFYAVAGYEEAAAQGLVAGMNAARLAAGLSPVALPRNSSYIGTLIDDLVTKDLREPYRLAFPYFPDQDHSTDLSQQRLHGSPNHLMTRRGRDVIYGGPRCVSAYAWSNPCLPLGCLHALPRYSVQANVHYA